MNTETRIVLEAYDAFFDGKLTEAQQADARKDLEELGCGAFKYTEQYSITRDGWVSFMRGYVLGHRIPEDGPE